MSTTEERVFKVFQSVFKYESTVDRESLTYNESEGWDSVGHMTLIAALEEDFDCMMETEEILDMSSFMKAVTTMEKYV